MKAAFALALSLFAAAFVSGCSSPVSLAQTPVSFATIQRGVYSGIREPLQMVIRTPDEWNAFWKRHTSNKKGASPAPTLNFSAEMVIGVFVGQKSTGGYSVEIVKVELNGPKMQVSYRQQSPPAGAIVIQALTQPFHLVKIPKHDASVSFSKEAP